MRARKTPDIGWRDLFRAALACLSPAKRRQLQHDLEATHGGHAALATLSVRSGFDLVLQCLSLPKGSEVLVSAVTIRDMVALLQHHGLRAVPIDLDPRTCGIDATRLHAALTPRTRAILVAHLFGTRMEMAAITVFAREHKLVLIEDCAQAFTGDGYRGGDSDVAMFSFGPIKTATALGGGLLHFRQRELHDACATLQHRWPVQSRATYLLRIAKYAAIKALCLPAMYTLFASFCRACGLSHDRLIANATRGFRSGELLSGIRRRPSAPLLSTLRRRLDGDHRARIAARIAAANAFHACAPASVRLGTDAPFHSHWVVPIASRDPDALVDAAWRAGFDATRGATSLHVVGNADGIDSAPQAHRIMDSVVYLPVETASPRGIATLAAIVGRHEAG